MGSPMRPSRKFKYLATAMLLYLVLGSMALL